MKLQLRPGTATYPIDEGLLFCGRHSSSVIRCTPGVQQLWKTLRPHLETAVDTTRLRAAVPEHAQASYDLLLAQLNELEMLIAAVPREDLSPARADLAHRASDVQAAWDRAGTATIIVSGDPAHRSRLRELLRETGLQVTDGAAGTPGTARVDVSCPDADRVAITAVSAGDCVLVTGEQRFERARAELAARSDSADADTSWVLARSVVVDKVLAALADEPPTSIVVDGLRSYVVRLAPATDQPHPIRWGEIPAPVTPDTTPVLGGRLIGPDPAELVQLPLARQRIQWEQTSAIGCGIDQQEAARDALLSVAERGLRRFVTGDHRTIAGVGISDVLARLVGVLAVEEAQHGTVVESGAAETAEDMTTHRLERWTRALRRTGDLRVKERVVRVGAGMVHVARADQDGATAWGYGTHAAQAAEHATRGLLGKDLDQAPPASTVMSAHDPSVAQDLVTAALGDSVADISTIDRLVTEQLNVQCVPWHLDVDLASHGVIGAVVKELA